MIKLPIILSVYKKETIDKTTILDIASTFICSQEFNNSLNYKLYDLKSNTIKSFIRNHIKILNGVHNNDLKNINKKLNNDNTTLLEEKKNLENTINEQKLSIHNYLKNINELNASKNIFIEKIKQQELDYELLKNEFNILKLKYSNKLKIINSSINQIIINEINNFEI
tara:strand:- start:9 stop:512 length:504 start_codon:yes stop_codon:yes gene_type:complete